MALELSDFYKDIDELSQKILSNSLSINKKLSQLVKGNDWSFIIKTQALIESSLTRLLIKKTNDEKFTRFFDKMSVSQKISLLKELELIESYDYKFIQNISELRNKLAHDPNEMSFTFKKYMKNMNEKEKESLANNFFYSNKNELDLNFKILFNKSPKIAIWISALSLLTLLNSRIEVLTIMYEINQRSADNDEKLLKELHPELFININHKNE